MHTFLLVLGTLLTVESKTYTDDRPYGSETLTYMFCHAHVVVRVQKAELLYAKKSPSVVGYRITFDTILHGNKQLKAATVDFPDSAPPKLADFPGALLFIGKSADGYFAVGDWLLKASQEERQKAATSLMAANSTTSKLQWSEKHIQSSDQVLQRSAILLVENLAEEKPQKVLTFLADALDNSKVFPFSKVEAIRVLGSIKLPGVMQIFRRIAENPKADEEMREESIKAMVGLPGWREVMTPWSTSQDEFLATLAQRLLKMFPEKK